MNSVVLCTDSLFKKKRLEGYQIRFTSCAVYFLLLGFLYFLVLLRFTPCVALVEIKAVNYESIFHVKVMQSSLEFPE